MCPFHDVRLPRTYHQEFIREKAIKARVVIYAALFKRHLKTLNTQRLFIDPAIPIQRPQSIIVVMIATIKPIKVNCSGDICMRIENFAQGNQCVLAEIPQGSIEIKK